MPLKGEAVMALGREEEISEEKMYSSAVVLY
jgi:hypothetical protein